MNVNANIIHKVYLKNNKYNIQMEIYVGKK